jgi:hypothetical protein
VKYGRLLFGLLSLWPANAWAQFEIDGVIHDSGSLTPIPGVAVFLRDETTGQLVSPGILNPPTQQGQITGANGRYSFRINDLGIQVRIELERPDSRFVFPSQLRPPEGQAPFGAVGCTGAPCPGGLVNFEPEPTDTTRHLVRFFTGGGGSGRNNHLPIDDLSRLFVAQLKADRQRARRGELIQYRATFLANARDPVADASIVFDLPPELRMREETLNLVRIRGGQQETLIVTPRRSTLSERWVLPELRAGDRIELNFVARVARSSGSAKVVARTRLERPGGIGISDDATAAVTLEDDPLLDEGTVFGQVYCEDPAGRPDWVDAEERGLYGARVYLDTGFYADTDVDGHFHFSGVPAGTRLLKLDVASLPTGSEPTERERAQLFLTPGAPASVRFPVACVFEEWSPAHQVELSPTAAPQTGPPPPATVSLPFRFEAAADRLVLGPRMEPWPRAQLRAGRDGGQALFWPSFQGAYAPSRWRLELEWIDAAGKPLLAIREETLTGKGRPPLLRTQSLGAPPVGGVALRAQLYVENEGLEWARSPLVDVPLATEVKGSTVTRSLGALATPELSAAGAAISSWLANAAIAQSEVLVVEAHWDAGEGSEVARQQAQNLLELVQPLATTLGPERLRLQNLADQVPIVPNSSRRLRGLNRRLQFSAAPLARRAPVFPKPEAPAALVMTIDGQEARLPYEDQALTLELDVPAQVKLQLRRPDGSEAELVRVVDAAGARRPGPRGNSSAERTAKGLRVGTVEVPVPAPFQFLGGTITQDNGGRRLLLRLAGGTDAQAWRASWLAEDGAPLVIQTGQGALPEALVLSTSSTTARSAKTQLWIEVRHAGTHSQAGPLVIEPGATAVNPAPSGEALHFGGEPLSGGENLSSALLELTGPVSRWVEVPVLADEAPVEGAKGPAPVVSASEVNLKSATLGQTLAEPRLPILGQTKPGNRIAINGVEVPVAEDGHFAHTAPLPLGKSQVRVESIDPDGHRAIFVRPVETSSNGWFLMGLAEAQLGTGGARLPGSSDQTHLSLDPIGLDGRITAYGRARFVLSGPYRRVDVVGRFDTAEIGAPRVLRLSNDPLRLLPAFGDASLEVQEAASRHLLFLDVRADDSRLVVGNHTTQLGSDDPNAYIQYRRTGFGAHADVRYRFGDHDETRVRGLYADGNQGSIRGHDELLGTGGSMYWLSKDELIEGSARVEILIRDRDTGQVIDRRPLSEGRDYELRPREGRLMLRTPLPGQSGEGLLGANRSVAHTGHPVYLVIDYEYLSDGSDERAFGAEVKEKLFDQLEFSATLAGEDRGLSQHRLYGVGLVYAPSPRSRFAFEYAESKGRTSAGRLSLDGGLSFLDLNTRTAFADAQPSPLEPFFGANDRRAYGLKAELDLADLGWLEPEQAVVRAYGRRAGLGFSALGSARDAGRLEAGAFVRAQLRGGWSARASVDGAITAQPTLGLSGQSRALAIGGVDYRDQGQAGLLEVAHLESGGPGIQGGTTGVAARYERRVLPELTLRIGQEALLQSDPVTPSDLGVLGTSFGASYQLTDGLSLEAAELLRWNGDNSTQLGMRVVTDEGLTGYIAERFSPAGRGRLTTIVGAEDHFGEASRTYGELQLDGGAHPSTSRAVLGMDHRFVVADGVELLLAYERAQLTDRVPVLESASPYSALFGGLSPTLGGFGDAVRLLPGAVSRDALAVGATWTPLSKLALSARFELRVDDGDEGAGGRDFLTLAGHGGATLQAHRSLTFFGRLTMQHTRDQLTELRHARYVEGSVRAAFRPHTEPWLLVLLGYTRQVVERPSVDPLGRAQAETKDAFSIEPIIDTPYRVQLVERLALLRNALGLPDGRTEDGLNVLWINRINAQVYGPFEASVEFRMLLDLALSTREQGFLLEAAYVPEEHLRVGVGYNFTRFGDDLLLLASEDNGGPFLRVTARY